jgi:NADH dehydrogenase FAD-containing subunit
LQAKARSLDVENQKVICEASNNEVFELDYDKLIIAVGVKTATFGIESIKEGQLKGDSIFFLKQLSHARSIRTNIIDSFEKAALPFINESERKRLLSFLIVGGGPTSCEFTSELHGKKDYVITLRVIVAWSRAQQPLTRFSLQIL